MYLLKDRSNTEQGAPTVQAELDSSIPEGRWSTWVTEGSSTWWSWGKEPTSRERYLDSPWSLLGNFKPCFNSAINFSPEDTASTDSNTQRLSLNKLYINQRQYTITTQGLIAPTTNYMRLGKISLRKREERKKSWKTEMLLKKKTKNWVYQMETPKLGEAVYPKDTIINWKILIYL